MHKIRIVDDETGIRQSLQGVLADEGYDTGAVDSGEECLKLLRREHTYDVVLLDIWLPGIDGLETLEKISDLDNAPEVIMISGHGTIESAVRATKLGAFDFLEKPLSIDKTLILVKNAIESKKLRHENVDLKKQLLAKSVIVGNSIPMKALRQQIGLMAPTNGRVLIYGESGTGKELVAHAIHAQSLRKDETFVEVNCAAIPEDLIESELFGHYKGSFPGAAVDKEGKFQKANGGTLFLDEVGDMSLKTQSKVLRTLDEQRVAPLGSDETITVDARIIASTNKDLEEEISIGNFREDLFYRLNVIPFFVPPLRDRKEDIPLLARHFLERFRKSMEKPIEGISPEAMSKLESYDWPGNVRELENTMERAVALETSSQITLRVLPDRVAGNAPSGTSAELSRAVGAEFPEGGVDFEREIAHAEKRYLELALEKADGVRTHAADLLKISYRSFRHYAKKHGL
jgi:two-component system, NtrC family, nitrogen regulation response regulator NtrX